MFTNDWFWKKLYWGRFLSLSRVLSSHMSVFSTSVYSTCGAEEGCILGFSGETSGKETFGRAKHRWMDNIKIDFREVGWGRVLGIPGSG